MNTFKSILVLLDRSDRDKHVCAKAVVLARALDARLELFLCDAERELAFKQSFDQRATQEGRNACVVDATRYLRAIREELDLDPTRITTSAWCDSPLSDALRRKVAQAKPDLVIKSPDCDHPGVCLAFSDTDWQIASNCPVPVLFARGQMWRDVPEVGAAIDMSTSQGVSLAREITNVASYIQFRARGKLEIVSCVAHSPDRLNQQLHARRLQELVSHLPPLGDAVHVLEGDADTALPRFAEERQYDVLVMGALAHRSELVPVVGSLTSKLINALECDFLLVKAPAGATAAAAAASG